jgi:hypothetical protein
MLKKKPDARAGHPASQSTSRQHRVDSESGIASKPCLSNFSPADACPAVVADRDFFRSHVDASHRHRFPLENEFPRATLDAGGLAAIVRVVVVRDHIGRPVRGRRTLRFCQGGNA